MIPITVPTAARSAPAIGGGGHRLPRRRAPRPAPAVRPDADAVGVGSAIAVTRLQRSTCHVGTYARHHRLAAQAFSGLPTGNGLFLGDNR